jgi:hypothetical protein
VNYVQNSGGTLTLTYTLPEKLQTWEFLPLYLRSLEPIDRLFCHNQVTDMCCGQKHAEEGKDGKSVVQFDSVAVEMTGVSAKATV